MDYRTKLFVYSKLYDHTGTDFLFVNAIRKNTAYHRRHCPAYAAILSQQKLNLRKIKAVNDLYKIPVLPTLYLKNHKLWSMSEEKIFWKATSSGTRGKKSQIGFDFKSLSYGAFMVIRAAAYHKLLSLKPVNYIILGYKPDHSNHSIASKAAFGATFFAPAIHLEYALNPTSGGYQPDLKGPKNAILKYARQPFPVRLIGFPAYTYFLLNEFKKDGIHLKLHPDSMVLLGGGWKEFDTEKVDKAELYTLITDVLGIPEKNCREFYGAIEHPIIYYSCKNHHFHVPSYSRVIVRDVKTLLPVKNGTIGLINLLTPMVESMPLVSIMTDDLGILHDGNECGCGINTPYFEVIGRVGIHDIKTCAAGANELLENH